MGNVFNLALQSIIWLDECFDAGHDGHRRRDMLKGMRTICIY